jgi:hypothetical protein
MKTNVSRLLLRAVLLAGVCISTVSLDGCKKSDVVAGPVDPSDANALSKVIVFPSGTQTNSGNLPTTTAPTVTIANNPTVSMTSGGAQVFVPIQYSGSTTISAVYVKIDGSDTYFKVPVTGSTTSGTIYVPISLPSNVTSGSFTITVVLVGSNGSTVASRSLTVPVNIKLPLDCDNGDVQGNAGITQSEHQLNGKAGNVTIAYNTFDLPDRIDVYVDGRWVAGTGTSIAPPPPLSTCANPLAGFVGKAGTFKFAVTSGNQRVQTYVSGCTGSSTAWAYELTCP